MNPSGVATAKLAVAHRIMRNPHLMAVPYKSKLFRRAAKGLLLQAPLLDRTSRGSQISQCPWLCWNLGRNHQHTRPPGSALIHLLNNSHQKQIYTRANTRTSCLGYQVASAYASAIQPCPRGPSGPCPRSCCSWLLPSLHPSHSAACAGPS